nr:MAG: early protein 6 [Ailuropoda melanoleuca papillomavirus 5]
MERPSSVRGLVSFTKTPAIDFLLPCNFCLSFLTNLEKALFDLWPLELLWRNGCAFGCCQRCIRLYGRQERAHFFERQISGQELKEKFGADLSKIFARCECCLKKLTEEEKLQCDIENLFIIVKGRVRGKCNLCKLPVF